MRLFCNPIRKARRALAQITPQVRTFRSKFLFDLSTIHRVFLGYLGYVLVAKIAFSCVMGKHDARANAESVVFISLKSRRQCLVRQRAFGSFVAN